MTINSVSNNIMADAMLKLNTMQRVNSAADDAAGLAIAEKMESLINGLDQGTDNTLDMQNLARTAEGALSGIDDSLQRIRELSVQASNGIYSDEDRALLQMEVGQLLEGINSTAQNTEFNNLKLLDGSFTNKNTASGADGTGASVSIPSMDTLALGLKGYDVSQGNIDLDAIDQAISKVSSTRSYLGAMENRFDYTVNSNSITMLNQIAAKSRIMDLDIAKGVNDMNTARILNEVKLYGQKQQMEAAKLPLSMLV